MQVDFERINHHSGQNFKSSETTPKTTEEWFQNIPCDVMKIIFKLYENDFKAFNYDIPIWLKNKIKCWSSIFLLEHSYRWSCQYRVGDVKLLTQLWFSQHTGILLVDVGFGCLYRYLTVTNRISSRTSCTNIRHQRLICRNECGTQKRCCIKIVMSNCEPLGSCPRERHTSEQKEVVIDLNYLQRRAVGVWHRSRIQDFLVMSRVSCSPLDDVWL